MPYEPEAEWKARARCHLEATPRDFFFPTKGDSRKMTEIRAFCAGCPVIAECLDYSLELNLQHGVWGGCSERERRPMRVRRNLALRLAKQEAVAS